MAWYDNRQRNTDDFRDPYQYLDPRRKPNSRYLPLSPSTTTIAPNCTEGELTIEFNDDGCGRRELSPRAEPQFQLEPLGKQHTDPAIGTNKFQYFFGVNVKPEALYFFTPSTSFFSVTLAIEHLCPKWMGQEW
ncbi:hypothetical protein Ciccas_014369 [Cichlidogyrus casuarinus]|uniref:Uncharacterized protein n=1 Tax=Cichlidogyrus casuarinus TaxID=1844966 RepID=A0ABD2PIF2_9PLAT